MAPIMKVQEFLDCFPDRVYRFIDQTGEGRKPVMDSTYRKDLNYAGYEAYFTVNGFGKFKDTGDNRLENLTSLNTFFVDIDGRKSLEEIKEISEILKPTFVIETMRGYHLYWMLDEPIYREDAGDEEWKMVLQKWERIEHSIVSRLKGDPVVKDATRILRVPGTFYWKKTGDAYKGGVEKAPFKIQIIESNISARYTMDQVMEKFPVALESDLSVSVNTARNRTQLEKNDFFNRVDDKYPIDERDSFKAMISGEPNTLPPNASRNQLLLIAASLARRAGWSQQEFEATIMLTGWHGMMAERSGKLEIQNTIASAYRGAYVFSKNHPIIEHNTTETERLRMDGVYTAVMKDKKEVDKLRISTYELEILARHPYLKKGENGIFFNYIAGVYKIIPDMDVQKIILDSLYEDMLWNYRTSRVVSDKIMCLKAAIPYIEESDDQGKILNVQNGLLNIITRELSPHTPTFVSLVQLPVAYDPGATAPLWEKCIKAWTEGDEGEKKARVLQEYTGYCLSTSTRHAKALFLIGDGGNGKSTFADTVAMLIGKKAVSRLKLEGLKGEFALAGLIGKRINIIEEVSSNFFHSDVIKALISGEEQTTNMKFKDHFQFKPQAKFIFAVNQMPRVDDSSSGMERRILAVHFKNNFRDNPNVDLRFSDGALAKELPGILNWALEGAKILADNKGFTETEEKNEIIQEYREENSSVDGFLAECTIDSPSSTIYINDLYEVYRDFCKSDGRIAKSRNNFSKDLRMIAGKIKNISVTKRKNGKDMPRVSGIELNSTWKRGFMTSYIEEPAPYPKENF